MRWASIEKVTCLDLLCSRTGLADRFIAEGCTVFDLLRILKLLSLTFALDWLAARSESSLGSTLVAKGRVDSQRSSWLMFDDFEFDGAVETLEWTGLQSSGRAEATNSTPLKGRFVPW